MGRNYRGPRSGSFRNCRRPSSSLLIDAREIFADACPDLIVGNNGWAHASCPFHADRHPSFAINLDSGAHFCRSPGCGVSGANIVSFVMRLHGLSYVEAMDWLETWQ